MWSENKMWVLCVVALIFLFLLGLVKVLLTNSKEAETETSKKGMKNKTKNQTNKRNKLLFESLLESLSIVMEMLPVFVGALLAILFTIYSTNQQDVDKLVEHLAATREDLSIQASILGELLDYYDDESLVNQLVLEASVDLTLLDLTINSEQSMNLIPGSAMGCILSNRRAITKRITALEDNHFSGLSSRRLVEENKRFLEYLVKEIDLVINYLNRDISVTEYEQLLSEHVGVILEENE